MTLGLKCSCGNTVYVDFTPEELEAQPVYAIPDDFRSDDKPKKYSSKFWDAWLEFIDGFEHMKHEEDRLFKVFEYAWYKACGKDIS